MDLIGNDLFLAGVVLEAYIGLRKDGLQVDVALSLVFTGLFGNLG
jgi:hypothetical protein